MPADRNVPRYRGKRRKRRYRITEDSPRWNWRKHGNKQRGLHNNSRNWQR